MEIRILGPLVVLDDRGTEVPLRGTRLRAVLALLVLHVGRVVAADRISEELWGDDPLADAGAALQNQVSRLRAALRAAGLADCIETRPPGYVLTVEPAAVDAWRFEDAVARGRSTLAEGDPVTAAAELREALALWRGDVLADLRDTELATAERARLTELRESAVEDRVDADLAAGRHAELVPELEALVAAQPLRERRTAHLMVALYRSGRQADALRAYQSTREHLADELGIDPGADLRRLEAAVLNQDAALAAPPTVAAASASAHAPAARFRIPTPLAACVGRTTELDTVEELLTQHRLVTLVGPGGAGKTRLAVEVGVRFGDRMADGAALVELASVEEPWAVVTTVARSLGIDDPQLDVVVAVLADRELLLVVDNCEHVLDEVADVVTAILGRCARVRVLTTSRQGLGLAGECAFLVPPLAADDAVSLFLERATALSSPELAEGDRARVAEICARLDGMPLAIELAASRTRVFSVAQLADRLDDRFRVVTGGARGSMARHRTLRAVVDWSYELLSDEERLVFDRLAAFAGSWSLEAAEAVVSGDGVLAADVTEIVDRLVDKSLVAAMRRDGAIRFSMLQTLAEYGRERLAARGMGDAVRRRLTVWLLDAAVDADVGSRLMSFAEGTSQDVDNVRLALAWAERHDPALALDLAGRLAFFWTYNDVQPEGWRALTNGLANAADASAEVRARAMAWAGALGAAAGDPDAGFRLGAEAVVLSRDLGDPLLAGQAALLHGATLTDRGDADGAAVLLDEARRQLQLADAQFWLAYLDVRASIHAAYAGDMERAFDLSRAALDRFRAIGDRGGVIHGLERFGEAAELLGMLDEAAAALEEAIDEDPDANVVRRSLRAARFARVRAAQDRGAEALALADEAVAFGRRQGWVLIAGFASHARGVALQRLGRTDEAIAELEGAIEMMRTVRNEAVIAYMEGDLAKARASE